MDHSAEIKAYGEYARARGVDVRTGTLKTMAKRMEEGVCLFSFLRSNARTVTYGTRCYSLIRGSDQKAAADFESRVAMYASEGRFLYYDLPERAWMMFDAASLIARLDGGEMDALAKHFIRFRPDVGWRAAQLSLLCRAELKMRSGICRMRETDPFTEGCCRNVYVTRDPDIVNQMNPGCLDSMDEEELAARAAEGKFGCFNIATNTWENIFAPGIKSIEDYDE